MDTQIEDMEIVETGKKDKGFTLVELLIVIVILGILATVTVFAVRGITDKGQANSCDVEKRSIETAFEAFFADTNADATTISALTPGYLKSDPNGTELTPAVNDVETNDRWQFVAASGSNGPTVTGVGVCA